MFYNAIQIKPVRDSKRKSKKASDTSEGAPLNPEEITDLAKEFVDHTTDTVTTAAITLALVVTGCQIAVVLVKALTR
jgi:hypothetical protein